MHNYVFPFIFLSLNLSYDMIIDLIITVYTLLYIIYIFITAAQAPIDNKNQMRFTPNEEALATVARVKSVEKSHHVKPIFCLSTSSTCRKRHCFINR